MNRFYLQMHITNKCLNRCKHCYQLNYKGKDMSLEQADLILAEMARIGKEAEVTTEVAITGGDPLMHPDFLKILERARHHCDSVYVMGNPELLIDDAILVMKKVGIDYFQLSLDGIAATHDRQRSYGSFQRTCEGIIALKKAGIKVTVNMTLSDNNRFERHTTEAIARTMGADNFSAEECIPHGEECSGKESHECSLGFSAMTVLPDLTLMACRRKPSSVLGKWTEEYGLAHHFMHNHKMIRYREEHDKAITVKKERRVEALHPPTMVRHSVKNIHEHWVYGL